MRIFRCGMFFLAVGLLCTFTSFAADTKPNIVKASDPGSLKLAFVTNNASEFWKIAAAGVHKYEKEAGVQIDVKLPPNGKTEEQNSIIENLVSQGYNGIAVSVIAPNDQTRNINRAAKATNLICFDSDSSPSPTASSTSARTTSKPARRWARRSSSFCPMAERWRSSSARSRQTTQRSG